MEHIKHLHVWMQINTPGLILALLVDEGINLDSDMKNLGIRTMNLKDDDDEESKVSQRFMKIGNTKEPKHEDEVPYEADAQIEQVSKKVGGIFTVQGYHLSEDEMNEWTRRQLLKNNDIWVCTDCRVGVNGLLSKCTECEEAIKFVPLTIEEFTTFVQHQRRINRDYAKGGRDNVAE